VEPAPALDVYLLMIQCSDFYVGGASWSHHREKFPTSSMTSFLRSCFHRMLRKEQALNRFFYSNFDLNVLEERKARCEQSHQDHGEPSSSGCRDPKEEPVEETTLDIENR